MTSKQTSAFWRLFGAACIEQDTTGTALREIYRKRVMSEELGVEHLSQIGTTRDYERIMMRLALDAGDYDTASRYQIGDDRRLAAMVADCAAQVFQLSGTPDADGLAYISGILDRSGLAPVRVGGGDYWLDIPEPSILTVFQILDTHRRRLIRRANKVDQIPVCFRFGRHWMYFGSDLVLGWQDQDPAVLRPFKVKIVLA